METIIKNRTASCACRQLKANCSVDPVAVSLCHCLECQRRTGSTYGIAAFFAREDVKVVGETSRYMRSSDNGHKVLFYFCPNCGSTVYWEPERMPNLVAVAVGSFADPEFPKPKQSVFEESKHFWVKDL